MISSSEPGNVGAPVKVPITDRPPTVRPFEADARTPMPDTNDRPVICSNSASTASVWLVLAIIVSSPPAATSTAKSPASST